jgi:hypothetical protein
VQQQVAAAPGSRVTVALTPRSATHDAECCFVADRAVSDALPLRRLVKVKEK